jgi:hypothetical protein
LDGGWVGKGVGCGVRVVGTGAVMGIQTAGSRSGSRVGRGWYWSMSIGGWRCVNGTNASDVLVSRDVRRNVVVEEGAMM